MIDISIIIPSSRPKDLAHVLRSIRDQHADGINYEIVLIQESNDFEQFATLRYEQNFRIQRQKPCYDNGASARDTGILLAKGNYVAFWDDDNVYYHHAIASLLCTVVGQDIGIVRARHQGLIIPSGKQFKPGDIDSMCFCVRKELAAKVKWSDNGGRYNDYRWISRIAGGSDRVNFSPVIIGEHL